mmetsp:Transcript_16212/g.30758  ORF Transcript_16212/g.30758 Transcript_16212/m.30758 type:complete len:363 (-) Transcript_16212:206-1294(-)|eukprot:CAMPEP_0170185160 /NCGR_PEP_ID=MMETSP0040_2-20121228/35796_1 /TAXON_ID=641309 /ORGANISM="Lotharella oceanica, Strain CCMP622" /LENGTH=362 /DNA_ID=CAMNT_0010431471 /DNA_START=119 /DNA_END=1207 /DNA_ORIENTATION=+
MEPAAGAQLFGLRRQHVVTAFRWLVAAPLALATASVTAHASATPARFCTAAGCGEGYEGVSDQEAKEWANKGYTDGDVIDSHIHVWGDGQDPFPYDNPTPDALRSICDGDKFVKNAKKAQVSGALIVQPINYKYDHTYVTAQLKKYPSFYKGMALANPITPPDQADVYLESLKKDGYVALRFNPYLWSGSMADDNGKAVYKQAGLKGMAVGVMCFKGLSQHMKDIKALLEHSPETTLIIDHWGFFRQPATGGTDPETKVSEEAWKDLLSLSEYPQVNVKLSALFRVSGEETPYEDLRPRLNDLIKAYGSGRLMWGSDYPYALVNGGYCASVDALKKWDHEKLLGDSDFRKICGGNAAAIFGF